MQDNTCTAESIPVAGLGPQGDLMSSIIRMSTFSSRSASDASSDSDTNLDFDASSDSEAQSDSDASSDITAPPYSRISSPESLSNTETSAEEDEPGIYMHSISVHARKIHVISLFMHVFNYIQDHCQHPP